MPITVPTRDQLTQAAQDLLSSRAGITNFASGSTAASLVGIFVDAQDRLYRLLGQAERARNIDTARGTDLDNLARAFGVARISATTAGSDAGAAQLLVTNNSSSLSVTFPLGSAVWAPSSPSTRFYSDTSVTIPAQTSQAVHLQASVSGQYQNAASGTLTAHNGNANLAVTNFLPITGGSSVESDEEFRYRLSQLIATALTGGSSSSQALETALRSYPGISDVILQPGTGALNVIVIPSDGNLADDDFLSSVQEFLSGLVAVGVTLTVNTPTILWVDTEISLTVSGDNTTPAAPLQSLLQTVAQNYLNTRQTYVTPRPGQTNRPSVDNTILDYTVLGGLVTDAALSQLGSKLRNLTLLLSTGQGQTAVQGDISTRDGEVIRARSVRVTATSSN